MSIAGRTLLRARKSLARIPSAWRINRLLWLESHKHRRLDIGAGTRFNVPVRSGGEGTLIIGTNTSLGYLPAPRLGNGEILLQPRAKDSIIHIGNHNAFNNNIALVAMGRIELGNYCLIGDRVTIIDCDFHEIAPQTRRRSVGPVLPVIIGDNVWIGSGAMVLKGGSIGDNSVVAASAVVTKPIPANVVVAGAPAQIIKELMPPCSPAIPS